MFKEYLKNQNKSIYKLSQESKIPYSTLNDLINHKLSVENLRSGQLHALSLVLGLSMDKLYQMCLYTCNIHSQKYGIDATVFVKHKKYYLKFEYKDQLYIEEIIAVKQEATRFIHDLAVWKLEEILAQIILEEAYETICSETKR